MSKLNQLAQKHNEPLDRLIPRIITEEGSIFKAAVRLGVAPNTLQYWMKKNGYSVETKQAATVVKEASHAANS